jgi:hypothetical protein
MKTHIVLAAALSLPGFLHADPPKPVKVFILAAVRRGKRL